jgi:transposase
VSVERIFLAGRSVRIVASTRCPQAACPECGTVSGRVHSRYERRLSDSAAGGQEVMICLSVRRFFCLDATCKKTTFADRSDVLQRYADWSPTLTALLEAADEPVVTREIRVTPPGMR